MHRLRRPGWPAVTAGLTALAMAAVLAAPTTPSRAAPAWLPTALDAAVLIDGRAQVWREATGAPEVLDWHGSGWTSECAPQGLGYRIRVLTAGHVLDVSEVLAEALQEGPGPFRAEVGFRVEYRDGSRFQAGLRGVAWGEGDSASLEFVSPVPRTCLAGGAADSVEPGDRLFVVACPGPLRFAVGEGVLSTRADGLWLSTLPIAPGASGAPVLTEEGRVVALAVGLLRWSWGTMAVLQPIGGRERS